LDSILGLRVKVNMEYFKFVSLMLNKNALRAFFKKFKMVLTVLVFGNPSLVLFGRNPYLGFQLNERSIHRLTLFKGSLQI